MLLRTHGLDAFYGDFQALFNVDLDIGEGEAVAVIGANGAGKSTFLRALTGMLPAPRNAVRFDGEEIGGEPANRVARRGIALVPEGRELFPSLSVEENLLMGACVAREGPWTLERVYALFPMLAERRKTGATSLSGGQQQMVAIGRALMANPRLLLCDEISLGLAPIVIRDIYRTLETVRDAGTTIVVVEQDIQQALEFADRAYCFQEGRVALSGGADELSREAIAAAYFGS